MPSTKSKKTTSTITLKPGAEKLALSRAEQVIENRRLPKGAEAQLAALSPKEQDKLKREALERIARNKEERGPPAPLQPRRYRVHRRGRSDGQRVVAADGVSHRPGLPVPLPVTATAARRSRTCARPSSSSSARSRRPNARPTPSCCRSNTAPSSLACVRPMNNIHRSHFALICDSVHATLHQGGETDLKGLHERCKGELTGDQGAQRARRVAHGPPDDDYARRQGGRCTRLRRRL